MTDSNQTETVSRSDASHENEVAVHSIARTADECILYLKEIYGDRTLAIWIGMTEGESIAVYLAGIAIPRPLTHDLLLSAIKESGCRVEKVVVNDMRDNTFYASIRLIKEQSDSLNLDCRPSDAIALAVRAGCPIYVEERVLASSAKLAASVQKDANGLGLPDLLSLREEDLHKT